MDMIKGVFKRSLYLGYYIKGLDRKKFFHFLNYAASETGKSKLYLLADMLRSVYVYNISILEYFQFRFYKQGKEERGEWAGTGYMYEYQLVMNPRKEREILDDKRLFFKEYRDFIRHEVASLDELRKNPALVDMLLSNPSGKLVLKVHDGKCGKQVLVKDLEEFKQEGLVDFMEREGYDMAEEFIRQHPVIQELSSAAVNTVRIFTQLDQDDDVKILGCRLRISIHMPVDNLAAGNIAAFIDPETGIISGPAVYSDIDRPAETLHPVSGIEISGFRIPFWKETLEMVNKAAKLHPQNRSIGWDIAITPEGPDLIEGNHDWCKLLYQLPAGHGLKHTLEKHLAS